MFITIGHFKIKQWGALNPIENLNEEIQVDLTAEIQAVLKVESLKDLAINQEEVLRIVLKEEAVLVSVKRCMKLSATNAVRSVKCLFSLLQTSRFIAVTVSERMSILIPEGQKLR